MRYDFGKQLLHSETQQADDTGAREKSLRWPIPVVASHGRLFEGDDELNARNMLCVEACVVQEEEIDTNCRSARQWNCIRRPQRFVGAQRCVDSPPLCIEWDHKGSCLDRLFVLFRDCAAAPLRAKSGSAPLADFWAPELQSQYQSRSLQEPGGGWGRFRRAYGGGRNSAPDLPRIAARRGPKSPAEDGRRWLPAQAARRSPPRRSLACQNVRGEAAQSQLIPRQRLSGLL
jgi:hypothetical protein